MKSFEAYGHWRYHWCGRTCFQDSKPGETTVHVTELKDAQQITATTLPIVKTDSEGQVHDAFTDPEQRYRMRYLDLIVNPHVRETFNQAHKDGQCHA